MLIHQFISNSHTSSKGIHQINVQINTKHIFYHITSKIILIAFGFLAKNKKGINKESFTHGAKYAKISQFTPRSKPKSSIRIIGIKSPRPPVMITTVAMFPAKGRFFPSEPMFGFKLKFF